MKPFTMKERAEYLYQPTLGEIAQSRKKMLDAVKETEHCSHIADRYWTVPRQEIADIRFHDTPDDVKFLRNIKPKFTSGIEYCRPVFHMSFLLPADPVNQEYFCTIESMRMAKFLEVNSEFCTYYKSGFCNRAYEYFIISNSRRSSSPKARAYDIDSKANTRYDPPVAPTIAMKRHSEYMMRQSKTCTMNNSQARPGVAFENKWLGKR